MKTNKIGLSVLPFFLGAVLGFSLFAMVSFTRADAPVNSPPEPDSISATDANVLLKRYLVTATTSPTPIKAFYIDLKQLDAMKLLLNKNSTLAGFRVYLGKTPGNNQVGIVVGVDNRGLDVATKTIYRTDSPQSGPCPTVCDASSPISAGTQ
jgi:hypothetical protein